MKYYSLLYSIGLGLIALGFAIHQSFPVSSGDSNVSVRQVPPISAADCESTKGLDRIVCLADAFKATLTSGQLADLQLPYSKTDATKWSNFPQAFTRPKRVGLSFTSFNASQQKAVKALLAAVLAQGVPNASFFP